MSDNSHSDLTVAFAFLAGTLVGAGVALLMAPRPGAETREQVGEWIQYLQQRVKEATRRGEDEDDGGEEAGDAEPAKRTRTRREPAPG